MLIAVLTKAISACLAGPILLLIFLTAPHWL